MKVVHLSTSSKGGAGIAALRLHRQLCLNGVDSLFISKDFSGPNEKTVNDIYPFSSRVKTIVKNKLEAAGLTAHSNYSLSKKLLIDKPKGYEYFSFPQSNLYIEEIKQVKEADIIHLHWIADDFINYPSFFKSISKPIVWTLHDMNPFTGGCHHSDDCLKFTTECTACPQLPSYSANKAKYYQDLKNKLYRVQVKNKLAIVTPSTWLSEKSKRSKCFSEFAHHVINNPVDSSIFRPLDKLKCRNEFGLPQDKTIFLFVSHSIDNPRKGIYDLIEAYESIKTENTLLVAAGQPIEHKSVHSLGYINNDNQMALAYNASDAFVLPSKAENYPNTITEALLCGVKVIASNTGGIPEQTGSESILVNNKQDLLNALRSSVNNDYDRTAISITSQLKFNQKNSVTQYISLYKQLTGYVA